MTSSNDPPPGGRPPPDERVGPSAKPTAGRQRQRADEQVRIAAQLQAAREEERQRLARELHDELGQTLTAMKLELARTIALLKRERIGPAGIDRLQSLVGLAEIGIATIKRITMDRGPAALEHLGLPAAIRWEMLTFRARSGLRCDVSVEEDHTPLSRQEETALFRILQEALTNIARHSRASAVHVRLAEQRGTLVLQVKDNGRGIADCESRAPGGIGLLGMRERASLIGGTLTIAGLPGKGTAVSVQVPLRAKRVALRMRSPPGSAPPGIDDANRLGDAKSHRHRGEGGTVRREHQRTRQNGMKRRGKA
jgi:signal transduction histidine kinase